MLLKCLLAITASMKVAAANFSRIFKRYCTRFRRRRSFSREKRFEISDMKGITPRMLSLDGNAFLAKMYVEVGYQLISLCDTCLSAFSLTSVLWRQESNNMKNEKGIPQSKRLGIFFWKRKFIRTLFEIIYLYTKKFAVTDVIQLPLSILYKISTVPTNCFVCPF